MAIVTIFTQVYNTLPYIRQCVESVLGQTFRDFEYVLIDNGSTDGCKEVLEEYAQKDTRIRLLRFEENAPGRMWDAVQNIGNGQYFSALDSDDWWEPNYLDSLLTFAVTQRLDIACTGTVMHELASGRKFLRSVQTPIILDKIDFPPALPFYHCFFRTHWNKLICLDMLRQIQAATVPAIYGRDTIICFRCLRLANRIGIDNTVLHHYRIHKSSASYKYNSERFEADVYLYNDAVNFLSAYGPISQRNQEFLYVVYANAVNDTLSVIRNSSLTTEEKLEQYRAIASHSVTQEAYRYRQIPDIGNSRKNLLLYVLSAGSQLTASADLQGILKFLCPRCYAAVQQENLGLFARESSLLDAVLRDSWDDLVSLLMNFVVQKKYSKQYDLGKTLCSLVPESSPLRGMSDTRFFRTYAEICMMVLSGNYLAALEEMTGLLLDDGKLYSSGDFLNLYICLAALLKEDSAFVFGKLRLAQHDLKLGRLKDCRSIADELTELGLENDELSNLYHKLENRK